MGITRKHIFVINPHSFRYTKNLYQVVANIEKYFIEKYFSPEKDDADYTIYYSKYPRDAIGFIRNTLTELPKNVVARVYAIGGDGILFDCLNGIMGFPNAELASIPYGSSNDFIRSFGEKKIDFFRNIALQATAPAIPTDVIYCGTNYALNCCCLGTSSRSQQLELQYAKRLGGLYRNIIGFLYTIGGIKAGMEPDLFNQNYELLIDGDLFAGALCDIVIANGPCYGHKKTPMPDALPNDGELDLLITKTGPIISTLFAMSAYLNGKYYKFPDRAIHRRAKNITITSDQPLAVILDGEFFIDTRLTVSLIPNAIKFIAVNNFPYGVKGYKDE
jgi:diacylglycerol kinase family enzyme